MDYKQEMVTEKWTYGSISYHRIFFALKINQKTSVWQHFLALPDFAYKQMA